jgi:hypothetical protein
MPCAATAAGAGVATTGAADSATVETARGGQGIRLTGHAVAAHPDEEQLARSHGQIRQRPRAEAERHPIDPHRPRDVLQLLLAGVLEGKVELVAHMFADAKANADASRLGQAFEPRSHIDAVPMDVVAMNTGTVLLSTSAIHCMLPRRPQLAPI